MDLKEFREEFINDIKAESINTSRYEEEVFIDRAIDVLQNDYSLISDMSHCYYEYTRDLGGGKYKSMRIDAANYDSSSGTVDLLCAIYNSGEIANITNTILQDKAKKMLNFFENSLKGYFLNAEESDPAVQLGNSIKNAQQDIIKIHLLLVSTDKISNSVKSLDVKDYSYAQRMYEVSLDVLDIEAIYKSKLSGFAKEDIEIVTSDFGVDGIPCIKAEIDTDQYDSYLAIVPGEFLSDIYKKYSASLLEANVRSFLKFNGKVNKGIRGTILNEKERFFTYNNGISTIAKDIKVKKTSDGLKIVSFTDLQIINGGQTTATLAATSIKNKADLGGIFVQMKLTVLKNTDSDLIKNIAMYANSQNKVKTADLNSSHAFYVRMEDYSRKIYAPLSSGSLVQQLWFFERARGQYDQAMLQLTKKQAEDYKLIRPKDKKFALPDLAKYANCADCLPHFVSWGGEVNSAHFHDRMVKQWAKDNSVYNERYYKELIAKKIMFSYLENLISDQQWYQEQRAYRPQLVAYTFSKFVYEVQQMGKFINYLSIWENQRMPEEYRDDLINIGKIVFDCIHSEDRSTSNIETYCKKEECWHVVQKKKYSLSQKTVKILLDKADKKIEEALAKKEQKFTNELMDEISIYMKGSDYWKSMISRGQEQGVLNGQDIKYLDVAVNYCNGKYLELSSYQVKEIQKVINKLKENMIV